MPKGYGYGNSRLSKSVGDSGGMGGTGKINTGGSIHGHVGPPQGGIKKGGSGNNIRGVNHTPHPSSSRPHGEVMCGPKSVSMGKSQGFGGRGSI